MATVGSRVEARLVERRRAADAADAAVSLPRYGKARIYKLLGIYNASEAGAERRPMIQGTKGLAYAVYAVYTAYLRYLLLGNAVVLLVGEGLR